jgi:hypothetical protein
MTDQQRAAANRARIQTRDWHEVPKGHYAIPVLDWSEWADRDCEDEPPVVAYRMFQRKVARHCKNGRVIGQDSFIRGTVWLQPGADPQQVRYLIDADDDIARDVYGRGGDTKSIVHAIMVDLENGDTYRARYGQITGRCGCCGKTLTEPKSKLIGIGPDCRGFR